MNSAIASATAAKRARGHGHLLGAAITATLIALFLFLRIWRLTAVSLDGDEIFSLLLARSDWHSLFAAAVRDAIHPPLFYVLLKIWVWVGGESLLWLRLFPVAVSSLCLVPVFLLCKDLGIPRGACNLALAIASVHPYAIYFAQHMRMYCLLGLFGLTSIWAFQRYLRDDTRRNLAILSAANLLLVYSHYYGWLLIGLEFLYLLWKRRRALPAFTGASLAVFVLFVPWVWAAAQSLHAKGGLAENLGWVPRPNIRDLTWFYVELSGFTEFLKIGSRVTLVILMFLYLKYRRRSEPGFHWLVVISLTPPLFTYLVSQWLSQSIWGHRHLVFALWPFLIVLTDAIWSLRPLWRTVAVALIVVWAGFAIAAYSPENHKIHWDRLTLAMLDEEPGIVAHVPLYSVDPYLHYPIWFHLESLKDNRLKALGAGVTFRTNIAELRAKAEKFEVSKVTSLDGAHGAYFWVGYVDSAWSATKSPREILEQRGCSIGRELTARDRFQSVTLFPAQCVVPNR
ncbi:MAG: glycosyltransferase family 39 protein [Candidatus Angelobacter sp.]